MCVCVCVCVCVYLSVYIYIHMHMLLRNRQFCPRDACLGAAVAALFPSLVRQRMQVVAAAEHVALVCLYRFITPTLVYDSIGL